MSRCSLALIVAVICWQPMFAQKPQPKRPATPPEELDTLPGFRVELLHTAEPASEGSWINLGKDHKGRLIIGGQSKQPVLRASIRDGKLDRLEDLALPIGEVMGILHAHGSLYLMGAGPGGAYGLYRCRDTTGDDRYDDVKLLKNFRSGGEHGAHALALGPDGMIYAMIGNHVKVIDDLLPESPYRNYQEDLLLPRQWDGNGHAAGILAPGGYVVRTDPDGTHWELMLGGFRNAYDFAFNADGELFTFDSDMEWDWGMPWYRPTRVNHCVSGGEYGWRSGTGVWPDYYPDSLPTTVDIGIGSPTGTAFGLGAKFPAKYQKAFFVCDWSYGRIFAVHFTPNGSSYTATFENFLAPKSLTGDARKSPLNLTDLVIGDDGALYFTVGGRHTQAALYRVSYHGQEPTDPIDARDAAGAKERALRRELETFHHKPDPNALAFAWPHLDSPDRFIRFAARVAVERQPVAEWRDRALGETRPTAALNSLLALARYGETTDQRAILAALAKLPFERLNRDLQLDKLRVLGVCFARMGRPPHAAAKALIDELDPQFPNGDIALDRELSQMLIYLRAPRIAEKCLTQIGTTRSVEDRLHYLFHLRTLPVGYWTLAQRRAYLDNFTKDRGGLGHHPPDLLGWFAAAGKEYTDGASFKNFLRNFLREAAENMSEAERKELDPVIVAINDAALPKYVIPHREFVKNWTMADLEPLLSKADSGRNFNRGRDAYLASQCVKCHKFADDGGAVGPDLTSIASRFDRRSLLESIVEPSKVVSDQYQNEQFTTADEQVYVGRAIDETPEYLVIQTNPLDPATVRVPRDGTTRAPSPLSPMPAGLIDVLTAEDILDLIAFMESGGNKGHRAFR